MKNAAEHRNRVRITYRFWVAVEGVDEFPKLRNGNVSASGVYFETDRSVGEPGTVQWLHLASAENAAPVQVMGRVVRLNRQTHGVALEFMPQDDGTREELKRLVREVATIRMQEEDGEEIAPRGAQPALSEQGVQRLMLETTLQMSVGEIVRLTIQTSDSGASIPLEGKVEHVVPMSRAEGVTVNRVSIDVAARPGAGAPQQAHPSDGAAVDLRFNDLIATVPDETEAPAGDDLQGSLTRIRLTSLLAFLERQRLSGELRLESGGRRATVYLSGGRLVDVESEPPFATPRTALASLLRWESGAFHFAAGEIDREDRLGIKRTTLLNHDGR